MKVLVVGSLRDPEGNEKDPPKEFVKENTASFRSACEALGGALARRKHTIMVGVPDWEMLKNRETVTTFIIEGASKWADDKKKRNAKKGRDKKKEGDKKGILCKVIFYGPRDREPKDITPKLDTLQELKKLPNIQIEELLEGGGASKARQIPYVADVDAVILISGREGTASIGYAAYSMRKPVIAITSFGGAAESIAHEVLIDYFTLYTEQGYITTDQIRDLDAYWDKDIDKNRENAEKVVELTEKLVEAYNLSNKSTTKILRGITGGSVILLAFWLLLYMSSARCTTASFCGTYVNIAFFMLLYASALLGAGLRSLAAYQKNKEEPLNSLDFNINAAISLLIAFGLALIYLIGGISFTGKVVVLGTGAEGQAFATVAVSMSLIGLAAGYLVPLSLLTDQLKKIIIQEKK
jgi:hypothetical protein